MTWRCHTVGQRGTSPTLGKGLRESSLVELDALCEVAHIQMVGPTIEVLVGIQVEAPAMTQRSTHIEVELMLSVDIYRIVGPSAQSTENPRLSSISSGEAGKPTLTLSLPLY